MPQKRAAYKEIRKSKKRRERNAKISSEIKTLVKKFNALLSGKKLRLAKEHLKVVSSKLHRASRKAIIRNNTASRKISRLSKKLHKATSAK